MSEELFNPPLSPPPEFDPAGSELDDWEKSYADDQPLPSLTPQERHDLIPTVSQERAVATISSDVEATRALVRSIIENVELMQQCKIAAASLTDPSDWLGYGKGRFQMSSDGAYRLAASARFLNIHWEGLTDEGGKSSAHPTSQIENEDDGTYTVIYEGIFFSNLYPRGLRVEGRCNSQNKFFKSGDTYRIPLKCEVREKALANLIMRGVARVSCLWHPSEELLKKAGLNVDSIQEIKFSEGSKGGQTGADITKPETLTKAKTALNELTALTGEDPKAIVNRLSSYTGKDGKMYGYEKLEQMKQDWQLDKCYKLIMSELNLAKGIK